MKDDNQLRVAVNYIHANPISIIEPNFKEQGIKNLVGVITSENSGSLKLFERCGYFKCGHLKNIGIKFGRALDVISYQKEI